jgi:tetratricopeptide (TPR) repeat protein
LTKLMMLLSSLGMGFGAVTLKAWQHNRAGVKQYEAKSYVTANREFMLALEDDPMNPEVQLNLGLTYEAGEEFDKAAQAYKGVLNLVPENSPLRFQALFNLAGAYAKQQKIDQALEAFQACLEMQPDSLPTKNNIELLWQGGGGGGKGGKPDPKEDKKDGRSNQEKREQAGPEPDAKKEPKPFQSKEMNKDDVKRILDEIKNQEQAIRANEYDKSAKEAPRGKDW